MGCVRTSYTAKFKLEVVKYVEETGKRAAGRKYDVDSKNIRLRVDHKTSLEKTNKNKQAFRGKELKYPQVETELLQCIRKARAGRFAVSVEMFQLEARKIANKLNISSNEFKASYGWIR